MKLISSFLIFFLCAGRLMSQTSDTTFIAVTQENGLLEKQQLTDQYDLVFRTMEPTRWLYTLNFTALSGSRNDLVRASVEVKLWPAIGLHGSYGIGFGQTENSIDRTYYYPTVNHRFAIEPRWYYAMPGRIRQGKSANNMSGNYIGLEGGFTHASTQYYIASEQTTLALRYGLQRRLFRYGVLDIGFGVGILKDRYATRFRTQRNQWGLFANSQIGLGLALARPKTTVTSGGYCEVLRCFREDQQMWKVDLYNLLRVNDLDNYKGQLSLAYELKLGSSPFSLEIQGEGSHHYQHTAYSTGYAAEISTTKKGTYGATLQARYYYSQKHRIATGKAGNNLSGVYVGTQLQWLDARSNQLGDSYGDIYPFHSFFNRQVNSQSAGAGLFWGIQHRLFQHGFIDFTIGNSLSWVHETTHQDPPFLPTTSTSNYQEFTLIFKLRAGLAF